ncbi:hypothetical protein IX53_02090 [Kosmotoga pacifica]|uniref:DNA polymerase III subunit gamma/tau n=1 Tax=Kosmotoga pacifica TaxID=1330330 RepID=A0A0G2ZDB6_9BACT|nr:hypothetical protein IX53_02090 [Kosmotoga pacifica]
MSEVLYRKYRPRNFEEIVGQEQVKQVLKKAIAADDIAHAYIFYGPRGTGKTTTARILAKAVNCSNKVPSERPCGVCDSCKAIDSSNYMDVIEIDAASYRGIDEVRKIRDAASYRPTMGRYKVYIIDEFHMLTKEAFNALLKTLEEPPEHILFILATTNLEKVPETVLSRCQIFIFKPLNNEEIINYLKRILEIERKNFDERGLELIARAAHGGMRDAVNLLQRTLVFSGAISEKVVREVLGILPDEVVEEYLSAFCSADYDTLIKISKKMSGSGYSLETLIDQAIEKIKENISSGNASVKSAVVTVKLLWEIARELRYSDDKGRTFETLNIIKSNELAGLYKIEASNVKPRSNVVTASNEERKLLEPEEKIKADDTEDDLSLLLDRLYSEGHILTWTLLSLSKKEIEEAADGVKKLKVAFSTEDSLAKAIFEEQFESINELVRTKNGWVLEFASQELRTEKGTDVLSKLPPEQQEYMKKIISLFDNVEIEVEEEEDG